jgi:hypothetical protein
MDFNRRREARARREAAVAKPEGSGGTSESQEILAELRENLDEAMAQLDADARELIIQRYFVGRPQVDLAAESGVAPSTIAHRLASAVDRLRACMKRSGKGMALGAAVLVAALEAEKACASVPAGLSANVMKIGLTGVGTAAGSGQAVNPVARPVAKIGLAASVAAILLAVLGLGAWSNAWRNVTKSPATIVAPAPLPRNSWSYPESSSIAPRNEAKVTAEVRVWTAEGMPVNDARVKLLDRAGKEQSPSDDAANKFAVSPGQYWAVVQMRIGEPQARLVNIGQSKDGVTAVDVLLR